MTVRANVRQTAEVRKARLGLAVKQRMIDPSWDELAVFRQWRRALPPLDEIQREQRQLPLPCLSQPRCIPLRRVGQWKRKEALVPVSRLMLLNKDSKRPVQLECDRAEGLKKLAVYLMIPKLANCLQTTRWKLLRRKLIRLIRLVEKLRRRQQSLRLIWESRKLPPKSRSHRRRELLVLETALMTVQVCRVAAADHLCYCYTAKSTSTVYW